MYRIYFIDNCNKVRSITTNDLTEVNLGVYNFIIGIDFLGKNIPLNSLNFAESENLERFFYGQKSLDSIQYLLNNVVLQPVTRHLEKGVSGDYATPLNCFLKLVKKDTITKYIEFEDDGEGQTYIDFEPFIINLPNDLDNSRRYLIKVGVHFPANILKDYLSLVLHQIGVEQELNFKTNVTSSIDNFYSNYFRSDLSLNVDYIYGSTGIVVDIPNFYSELSFSNGNMQIGYELYEVVSI